MLDLVWKQWTHLGIYSDVKNPGLWIIDPEALLLFTLEIGRYDARLYDEVLSWLVENEQMINAQRLQNIMKADENIDKTLIAAAASILLRNNRSAKWKKLSANKNKNKKPLFLSQDAEGLPVWGEKDEDYIHHGWIRPNLALRKISGKIDLFRLSNLVIRLRYLFGINLRAELVVYLLTHEAGNPTEISKKIYYSQPTIKQVCDEIEKSGMALMTPSGREIKITLDPERWAGFLKIREIKKIRWVNWPEIFKAFNAILRFLFSRDWSEISKYIQISESTRIMKEISKDLSKSNTRLFINDTFSANVELHLKEFVGVVLKSL